MDFQLTKLSRCNSRLLVVKLITMKREPGYYWVVFKATKQISLYINGKWAVFGYLDCFKDKDFTKIFEDKICQP